MAGGRGRVPGAGMPLGMAGPQAAGLRRRSRAACRVLQAAAYAISFVTAFA